MKLRFCAPALFFLLVLPLSALPPEEYKRIEALIRHVEGLEGAVFIRNGTEHTCAEAAAHMRRKWNALGDRIKTAEDFVRMAATSSSITGRPYTIRFKDGRTVQSGPYLLERLKLISR